jgi:hypothetical protein
MQFTVTMFNAMGGVKPFFFALDDDKNNDFSTSFYNSALLPEWYKDALEHDETFKVFDLPTDLIPPSCRISEVQFDPDQNIKIFPDTQNGEPEHFVKVFVEATDFGGGVVAGAEISIMMANFSRWHIAFSAESPDKVLSGVEPSFWMAEIPFRELGLAANLTSDVGLVKEMIMSMGKCRATDDSLNTNFLSDLPPGLGGFMNEDDLKLLAEEKKEMEKRLNEGQIPTSKRFRGTGPLADMVMEELNNNIDEDAAGKEEQKVEFEHV